MSALDTPTRDMRGFVSAVGLVTIYAGIAISAITPKALLRIPPPPLSGVSFFARDIDALVWSVQFATEIAAFLLFFGLSFATRSRTLGIALALLVLAVPVLGSFAAARTFYQFSADRLLVAASPLDKAPTEYSLRNSRVIRTGCYTSHTRGGGEVPRFVVAFRDRGQELRYDLARRLNAGNARSWLAAAEAYLQAGQITLPPAALAPWESTADCLSSMSQGLAPPAAARLRTLLSSRVEPSAR